VAVQARSGQPDAIAFLLGEHREVEGLFTELQVAAPDARAPLLGELARQLETHTEIEEDVLYPVIRRQVPGGEELMAEAEQEHAEVRKALGELIEGDSASPATLEALAALRKAVQHHVREEERQVLPKLQAVVDTNRLLALSAQLKAAKLERLTARLEQGAATSERPAESRRTKTASRSGSRTRRTPVHVMPHGEGRWAVRREGATRASSLHASQEEAERQGRATAKRERVEFELHGRDGQIRVRESYGADADTSKG
jgi:iron-sulfur cluster repair protein YtfE (RIC family)